MTTEQKTFWSEWARATVAALFGAGLALVAVTRTFGDVEHKADVAEKANESQDAELKELRNIANSINLVLVRLESNSKAQDDRIRALESKVR